MRWLIALFFIALTITANVYVFTRNRQRQADEAVAAAATSALDSKVHDSASPSSHIDELQGRTLFASGTVEGAERESQLRFELQGRLLSIDVHEGDVVKQGDSLARLDPIAWEAQLAEAEASLAVAVAQKQRLTNGARKESRDVSAAMVRAAEARAEQSRKEFQRSIPLIKSKSLAQQEVDELESKQNADLAELDAARARRAEIEADAREDEVKMADAKIAVAEAKVRQAKVALDKAVIHAPTAGLILRTFGEPGEMVLLERQDPIVTMVGIDNMHVRAYVEELDAFRVAPGSLAMVTADGLPGLEFPGKVTFCAPYMTPKKVFSNKPGERVDVKVREVLIQLDKQATLVVGLPVDVHFSDAPVPSPSAATAGVSPTPSPGR